MIKLTDLIIEATGRPKVIIMAGGAAVGKSYLLTQLGLSSLPQVNPDKYVEDPEHPAYNNLGAGARLADKEAEDLATSKTSFVWDTTASNPKKVYGRDALLRNIWGTDVHVVARTVDVHIRKIREKIGQDYITTIKGVGYKFKS